jgi:hypothetical protein
MRARLLVKKTLKYSLVNTTRAYLGRQLKTTSHSWKIGSRISPNYLVKKSFIIADFTELEVMEAIMEMKKSKAPGPDGSPAKFYQVLWDTIKDA